MRAIASASQAVQAGLMVVAAARRRGPTAAGRSSNVKAYSWATLRARTPPVTARAATRSARPRRATRTVTTTTQTLTARPIPRATRGRLARPPGFHVGSVVGGGRRNPAVDWQGGTARA